MEHAQFKAGDIVLKKGDEGDAFFIIEEGLFSIYDGMDCGYVLGNHKYSLAFADHT